MGKVIPIKHKVLDNVKEVLAEASEMDFDTIMLVGMKGTDVHLRHTKPINRLEVLGALSSAQTFIYEEWGE